MREKIVRSIVRVMAIFFSAQAAVFTAARALAGAFPPAWPFFAVSAAVHALVTAFLIRLKDEFVIEPSGRRLESVNAANIVTLVRISTLPTLLFLILADWRGASLAVILALSAATFGSDLLDGYIARRLQQRTRMGRMLDSVSDYLLLAFLSIALVNFRLIDAWYFGLILGRLAFQSLGMTAFFLARRPLEPRPTLPGKAAVASTMILYGLAIIKGITRGAFDRDFFAFEVAAAVIVAASVVDKAIVFARHGRATAGRAPKRPGPARTPKER